MAATRRNSSFQIYQDNFVPQPMPQNNNKPRPQLQPSAMPLQPLGNMQGYPNMDMNGPLPTQQQISPLKSQPMSPAIPQYPDMGYVHIPAPIHGQMYTGSPMKQPLIHKPQQYHLHPASQPMFTTFSSNPEVFPADFQPVPSSQNESSDFPMPQFSRQTLKRSYSDAAPLNDRPLKRLRSDDDTQLPNPEEMPHVEDDGNKPGFSYAQMIGMAILRAPNRRLTLAQIYDWISTTFAFYREDPKQGWHNSIRHNLSLNKAFKKQERPKGDAGKGSYWIIEPGMESQFFKEKARKSSNIVGMAMQTGMRADIHVMAQPLAEALTPSWSVPIPQAVIPPRPQTAPILQELSSDATLPASDPALNEDQANEATVGSPHHPSSPPIINSSPPVAASNHHRTISSPVHIRPPPQPKHKRSNTTIDDSGYFSELPSSARRPKANGIILTSEINIERPRTKQKRGRAEEEILRIRSSPHVTPSSRRLANMLSELDQSSSPGRPSPSIHLQPSTPAVQFKKPTRKPPASISPNTQLQQHRLRMQEYTDSPIKRLGLLDDTGSVFSPHFTPMSQFRSSHFEEQFSIFEDTTVPLTPGLASSPIKSVKRPTLPRSNTSAGVLRDVSASNKLNLKTPSKVPSLKPAFKPLKFGGSPLKRSTMTVAEDYTSNTFDVFDENTFVNADDFDTTLINDENSSEIGEEGVDLLKGFANIGQSQDFSLKKLQSQRPGLGVRSNTTAF